MSKQILADAIAAYQRADYPRALEGLEKLLSATTSPDVNLLALAGNVNFRLGRRKEAADAFLAAAKRGGPEAAKFVELAVNLYFICGDAKAILDNVDFMIATAPNSSTVAYACAKLLFQEKRWNKILPLLDRLDMNDDGHVGLMVQCHRAYNDLETPLANLKSILDADPSRDAARMLLYFTAQDACDYALQAERDAYLASLDRKAFEAFLVHEPLHGRLFRSEDERVNTLPAQQYAGLNALKRDRRERRTFSAGSERISVGYLSNDFHNHATMVLLGEALNQHDESRFDITLFCYTAGEAALDQQRWPEKMRKWLVSIRELNDEAAAELIDQRKVDILVDLKGHTLSARPRIVNLCRAPVKVSYLGFPGSIPELDYDYIIGDPVVTPDAFKAIYPEKLCRLPGSYQCNNSSWRQRPVPDTRSNYGLPEDAFVFASFNQTIKITRRTIALWADILRQTPGSVLWLMAVGPLRRRNLLAAFEEHGIDPARIIFASPVPFADHGSRIALADLALDTFPCNGHTTTSDMLWAGLPVVTVLGEGFASRVSASLLGAVGLSELVMPTDSDFVEKAVSLAKDKDRQQGLKRHLSDNRRELPLYDTKGFTSALEKAYEAMAERARTGLPPDHIDVLAG